MGRNSMITRSKTMTIHGWYLINYVLVIMTGQQVESTHVEDVKCHHFSFPLTTWPASEWSDGQAKFTTYLPNRDYDGTCAIININCSIRCFNEICRYSKSTCISPHSTKKNVPDFSTGFCPNYLYLLRGPRTYRNY